MLTCKITPQHEIEYLNYRQICIQATADDLSILIDTIIFNEYILQGPSTRNLLPEEQKALVAKKRQEILEILQNMPISSKIDYVVKG